MNEYIYKIGKTEQEPNSRLAGYPKGSEVILFINTKDNHSAENKIITIFKNIFKQRTDVGKEYFEGDKDYMIKIICDVVNKINSDESLACINISEHVQKKFQKVGNENTIKENELLSDNDSNLQTNIIINKSVNIDKPTKVVIIGKNAYDKNITEKNKFLNINVMLVSMKQMIEQYGIIIKNQKNISNWNYNMIINKVIM